MANHEIAKESDQVTLQTQDQDSDSIFSKIAREAYVIGAGTIGGAVKEGWKEAVEHPGETALKLGTAASIGLALGYMQRGAGLMRMGGQALGAAFGISFMADVVAPKRWEEVRSIAADTWVNSGNTDRNLARMEKTLGHFAFDVGLMTAGGIGGAKLGQKLGSFNMVEAPRLAGAVELPLAARVAELKPGEMTGHELRANARTGEVTPWDTAKGILETKKTWKLEEASEMFKSMQVGKDGVALELKGKVAEINTQGGALKTEIGKLQGELTAARAELKAAEGLAGEQQAVKRAQTEVETLKGQAKELPAKEAELKTLTEQIQQQAKAKEDARGRGGKGEKKGGESEAPQVDLKARARELREEVDRIKKDTNEGDPNSALTRARARQAEAEQALATAEAGKAAKMDGIQQRVSELEGSVAAREQAHKELGEQMRASIEAYQARVTELMGDTSKIVEAPAQPKAEVPRPAAKPREVKAETTTAGGDKGTGKPAEVKVEKPVEVAKSPEQVAMEKVDASLKAAKDFVAERAQQAENMKRRQQLNQDLIQVQKERGEIESGKKSFADAAAKDAALEAAKVREAKLAKDISEIKLGKAQYHRPLNAINEYAKSAENYLAAETNGAKRDAFVREAVKNIEEMMLTIPNSFKGQAGEKGIPGPGQARGITAERRLAQLREHLDTRLTQIDAAHTKKVSDATSHPVIKEAFEQISSGAVKAKMSAIAEAMVGTRMPAGQRAEVVAKTARALYENSTVVFFENGKLVQNRSGQDGKLYPQFFDPARVELGQGRLDRMIGHAPDGYAIVAPKVRPDGRLIELTRPGKGGNGRGQADKPTFAKEVVGVGGEVPAGVAEHTSFGEILKNFRGEPAPKVEAPQVKPAEVKAAEGDATTGTAEVKPEG